MKQRRLLFFLFILSAQAIMAQGGAVIKAVVDKNKILIGEPVVLTIEANLSPESVISFVNVDSIGHFEFLEKPVIDTVNSNGGTTIKGVYKITSFDSGHWTIPSFSLSAGVKTDSIGMDVVFSDFDPNQDYHDIKDILEVNPVKKKQQWWWYAAGGALVILALLLVYFLRKKKPLIMPVAKAAVDPYTEAMNSLQQLEKNKPEVKLFHSKLTDIFRLYIFRKKGILSLQKTTDDLVVQVKELALDKDQFDKLSQSLRLSDFVKFAKFIPTAEDDMNALDSIRNAIKKIEQVTAQAAVTGATQ